MGQQTDGARDWQDRFVAGEAAAQPGVAGRADFAARLQDALNGPGRRRGPALLMAVSLDNLRDITNLHGEAVAEQVVRITAERLLWGTRSRLEGDSGRVSDLVAKLAPGQFGVMCGPPGPAAADAERLARRIHALARHPIAIGELSLRVAVRVGLLLTTQEHGEAEQVLRDLDFALERAQSLAAGAVVAWEPALTEAATRRYSTAEQLHRAFDNGEFLLHYQPVLQLDAGRLVGVEALLRWNRPSDGLVPAALFVPALDDSGLISEVGRWVVREAVRQIDSWQTLYGRDIVDWVGINLSARQFSDASPLLATLRSVHESGFSIDRLMIEVSEVGLTRNRSAIAAGLDELRAMGARIAIDDFGGGYASASSLRDLPIDVLKIDREFVGEIGSAPGDRMIEALLEVARLRNATVIATGVENAAQQEFLRAAGCLYGQGSLFSEPIDGALLGVYALTRATCAEFSPPTSAGPSPAMSDDAAHAGWPARRAGSSSR